MSYDDTPIKEQCNGRWRSILTTLGIPAKALTGKHGPCPMCTGGVDRFRFDDKNGEGRWLCGVCGSGDGFDLLIGAFHWKFQDCVSEIKKVLPEAKRQVVTRQERSEQSLRDAMNRLWTHAKPLDEGDPVSRYLEARGIEFAAYPPTLRYFRDTKAGLDMMLAKVTAPDGRPCQIHRTWLGENGQKADIEAPRKLMPGKITKGSAIRLGIPGDLNILGVAEGIETALSASVRSSIPVWAVISTAGMMQWECPPDVERVVIFGDHDVKFGGQSAAYALAHRLTVKDGKKVRVAIPAEPGDWNDVLKSDRVAEQAGETITA